MSSARGVPPTSPRISRVSAAARPAPKPASADPPAGRAPVRRVVDRDGGAVTVEAALGIGSVVAVFLLVLSAMSVLLGQLRCTDAAVEAARAAAGGDRAGARAAVGRLAPAGSTLTISTGHGLVTAEVIAPPGMGLLPEHWRRSRAAAAMEPGEPEAVP